MGRADPTHETVKRPSVYESGVPILCKNVSTKKDSQYYKMSRKDTRFYLQNKVDLENFVQVKCKHLKKGECHQLPVLLYKYKEIFNRTPGCQDATPVKLELKEDIAPFHQKAYLVPYVYQKTLNKEIECLCLIDILK